MRIAYIAPYHGPSVIERRPIIRNRSMAGTAKIELIACLLRSAGHEVEILSQGEVVETSFTFYPSLRDQKTFHAEIPVYYSSVLPIRRLNGIWSNQTLSRLFRSRHRRAPFDLVIIYNLKTPQIACAQDALALGIPVVLEYEDDRFVNVQGEAAGSFSMNRNMRAATELFPSLSGCLAVSPHLLGQLPAGIPKLLLRGIVGADIIAVAEEWRGIKENVVLFSGTHIESNGVAELIEGWRQAGLPDWELHITGFGHLSESLRRLAANIPGIVFHGLVSRTALVQRMCSAKICINPHQVSKTPGNVFAFKIVEYLASGGHVITTPMGALEPELEAGITYMSDNSAATIAATLRRVIRGRMYESISGHRAQEAYGPEAVSKSLDSLLSQVNRGDAAKPKVSPCRSLDAVN